MSKRRVELEAIEAFREVFVRYQFWAKPTQYIDGISNDLPLHFAQLDILVIADTLE